MRWRSTLVAASLLISTLTAPVAAQLEVPEAELLEKVATVYRTLKGPYLFQGTIQIVTKGQGEPQLQQVPFLLAAAEGGRLRDESPSPTVGGLVLCDGKEAILYNSALGQFKRRPIERDSTGGIGGYRGVGGSLLDRYTTIVEGATSARRVGDGLVYMDGKRRDCVTLEVTYRPSQAQVGVTKLTRTYWIEKGTHFVLRQVSEGKADAPQLGGAVEQREEIDLQRLQIGGPLPDSLWTFRPPAGVREVPEFMPPEELALVDSMTGRPAIDFTLNDLKGRPQSLQSRRGKVVLLDFWATWCGPCRITMPKLAKIDRDYRGRGLEVLSVNIGETAKKAGDYLAKNKYSFTALLDPTREVANQYRVNGIPTLVVIDRSGKVTDYLVGAHDDATLRAALLKAGVK